MDLISKLSSPLQACRFHRGKTAAGSLTYVSQCGCLMEGAIIPLMCVEAATVSAGRRKGAVGARAETCNVYSEICEDYCWSVCG